MNRDKIIRLMEELEEAIESGIADPDGFVFPLGLNDLDVLEAGLSEGLVSYLEDFDTLEEAMRELRYSYGRRVDL